MGPRLDVRPDAFYDAAQTLIAEVMAPAHGAALRASAALDGCAEMAGSDPPAREWAGAYDDAARSMTRSIRLLLDTTYHLGTLLERTGLNHARAEAASTAGAGPPVLVMPHTPGWRATLGSPPSAAGGRAGSPTGWGLVQDLVGYAWPSGHQDRLHRAADAWVTTAEALDDAAGIMPSAGAQVTLVRSPEVDDALEALAALRQHYRDLARIGRELARACRELAHRIDAAHSSVEHELVELVAFIGGTELVGAALGVLTFGAAELPTQAAVAARVASSAGTVRTVLGTLRTVVGTLAAELLPLGELAESVAAVMGRLAGLRPAIAGFEDVAALGGEMRMAKAANSVRREIAAERRLAAATTRTVEKANSPVWKRLTPHKGKTRSNGLNGKRRRFYQWDHTHHDIEVYDNDRKHLGSMDPVSGKMTKPAVPGRELKND